MGSRGAEKVRFYELDLARFTAAMLVVAYHYTFASSAAHNVSGVAFPALGSFFRYGYLGVEFFFMISGFVILMTALGKSPKQFVISRFVRLYPVYWVGVILTFLVLLGIGHEKYPVTISQALANLTMLQSLFGVDHIDGVYWSLVVELKFYLVVFIAMVAGLIRFPKALLVSWLLVSALLTHVHYNSILGYFLIPEWSSFFVAGCAFLLIRREGASKVLLGIVAGSFVLSALSSIERGRVLQDTFGFEFVPVLIVLHLALFYLFFLALSFDKLGALKHSRFVLWGALSYPIYLIHQRIGYVFFEQMSVGVPRYLSLALIVTAVLCLSWALHRWVEKPGTPLVRRALQGMLSRTPGGLPQ